MANRLFEMCDVVFLHICTVALGAVDDLLEFIVGHPRKRREFLFEGLGERLVEPFMPRPALPDSVHPQVLFRRSTNHFLD